MKRNKPDLLLLGYLILHSGLSDKDILQLCIALLCTIWGIEI
jgi:hypothetical protein